MENKPMTVLIIEDDENACQSFINYIDSVENIKIVGITNSSDEGIEIFNTYLPEAIILDIELHNGQGSGIDFIEKIKKYTDDFKPIIFVTTNASSKVLYDKLHEEGIELIFYKKQKDYSPKLVVSSLLSLRKSLYKYNSSDKGKDLYMESKAKQDNKISTRINTELDLIGVSSHLTGRKYLFDAIKYLLTEKDNEEKETVFNHLANIYKKSSSSISRVMQTAINYAWRTSAPEDLEVYYTAKINYNTGVPTPTEFIYYYYQKINKNI